MIDPSPPGPAERRLYLTVLEQGGRVMLRDIAPEGTAAMLGLVGLGLLIHHTEGPQPTAVNPRSVSERIGAELRSAGARLIARAEETAARLDDLTEAYDAAPPMSAGSNVVQHIDDLDQIRHRLLQIEADFREEVLAAQPGLRPPEYLADNLRIRRAPARGATVNVLYQPVSEHDPATAAYAARATGWGMRLRVLDEDFTRQRDWERAERGVWQNLREAPALPVHEQVGRLLAQGLTQRAVASRLGLSERTVAGHIARLRDLFDAETLFQLGWLMRSGVE